MVLKKNLILIFYGLILTAFLFYSYCLVDPNLTLINHPLWAAFREYAVTLGYHNRNLSSYIYLSLVCLLFLFNFFLIKNYKKYNAVKLALFCGFILLLSYPLLSHDFFNYLFDARILTFHHSNPYLSKALDFPTDPWIRFMHWTHRTYPYGPSWLAISLIPSFLSLGKFILNFLLFKLMFAIFYIISVYYLNKIDKKQAIFFATHPLVLIEGLINSHNDIVATSIALIGIYLLMEKKNKLIPFIVLLLSAAIKYITIPVVFLSSDKKSVRNTLVALGLIILLGYLSLYSEIQPWYYLGLFVLLPYFFKYIEKVQIFFFGLVVSYYPYLAFDGWAQKSNVILKHNIIIFFAALNIIIFLVEILKSKLLAKGDKNRT